MVRSLSEGGGHCSGIPPGACPRTCAAAHDIDGIVAEPRGSVPRDSETGMEIEALSGGFTRFLNSAETRERGREQAMRRRVTAI